MTGFVGEKLEAAYTNRIEAQNVARLIEPFKNRTEDRCWQSEFWGKWFTSAVLAYRFHPEPRLKAIIDNAVTQLIQTQTPDGYIGNYAEAKHLEQWDIWGRKYCMLGLLSYYDLTRDGKSLQAARRLADHLIKELQDKKVNIVQMGNHRGMAATSVLEPITLLYARTGDKRYLDFAEEIVRQWESPMGPQLIAKAMVNVSERFPPPKNWWGYEQGQKAYEMMSCYEGLLELYRLTGKETYKTAVETVWENIRSTEINAVGSGSSMECWFGGKGLQPFVAKHYQETCVTATWIKLSQQLLRLTGEAKYADAIEQSFYNALLGSMKPDGSTWAKYSPIEGIRSEGEDQCHMGLNCCVASGPRGLFTIPLTSVMRGKDGLTVNFFNPGSYKLTTPKGEPIELVQETEYPVNGIVTMRVNVQKPELFTIHIRIPQWSNVSTIKVNGEAVENVTPGAYTQ
ncbi:MAG: glycoside hydrolase family 127 protein, partial [Flavisolibacter sp.]|nr:glycoside hydrolase family 127 protein [Flavisolibacter sp.]